MTRSDNTLDNLMAEAERLGKEQESIEKRNQKRRAKGRKPLPDPQEQKDLEVQRRRYRTGDSTTVDAADAMKLFELRKAEMRDPGDSTPEDIDDEEEPVNQPLFRAISATKVAPPAPDDAQAEAAVKAAEAARRVQDLKNGRVDHAGNWSEEGQKLEGGDTTQLVTSSDIRKAWGDPDAPEKPDAPESPEAPSEKTPAIAPASFQKDLYARLAISFEALERSLSDLQGRVAEIVTATTPKTAAGLPENGADEFQALLDKKTPVVFDVGGTKMTFDAICVFSAPPCITVVSKIGSAKITPKPGAQLQLSYEMDGKTYTDDPVTFLGTRFDLPMFGLSFVGFIRDAESDMIDVEAGLPPEGDA